jgi:hypothetical protein
MARTLPPVPYDRPQTSYEWVQFFTELREIIDTSALDHNALQNLQGGAANEFNHLSDLELAKAQNAQVVSEKDTANGYAGLNASSRTTKGVDTTDDVVIDLATKGLVLKDTQGTPHYWRVTISTTGVLTTADLGTTKP